VISRDRITTKGAPSAGHRGPCPSSAAVFAAARSASDQVGKLPLIGSLDRSICTSAAQLGHTTCSTHSVSPFQSSQRSRVPSLGHVAPSVRQYSSRTRPRSSSLQVVCCCAIAGDHAVGGAGLQRCVGSGHDRRKPVPRCRVLPFTPTRTLPEPQSRLLGPFPARRRGRWSASPSPVAPALPHKRNKTCNSLKCLAIPARAAAQVLG
jgi:hypothetical protein